jgi:DNA-binding transcriptional LysR family regulator
MKANVDHILSVVDGRLGITVVCESAVGNALPGVVFREIRDGNGPTRVGYVAYWRRNNDNPALKQMLSLLKAHPAVPRAVNSASEA